MKDSIAKLLGVWIILVIVIMAPDFALHHLGIRGIEPTQSLLSADTAVPPAPPPDQKTTAEPAPAPANKPDQVDAEKMDAAKECYNLAAIAYNNKDYEKARDYLFKAISLWKAYAEAYALLGDTFDMLKDDALEYEFYRKCVAMLNESAPLSPAQSKLRDETSHKADKFKPITDRINALNKECLNKWIGLGRQAMEENDFLLAQDIFTQILAVKEDEEETADYLKQVNAKLAKDSENNKSETNADFAKIFYDSGVELLKQNKFDDAAEKFSKSLSYKRDWPNALLKLGMCYEKTNKPKDALKTYRLCVAVIKSKTKPSADDKDIMIQAQNNLSNIDTQGNEANKIADKYVTGLLAAANDCVNRKFDKLALRFYDMVLKLDPDNKTASDNAAKLRGDAPAAAPDQADATNIFNGANLVGWWIPQSFAQIWTVDNKCLAFNKKGDPDPSVITYSAPPKSDFIFCCDAYIEQKIKQKTPEISVVYGGNYSDFLTPNKVTDKIPLTFVKNAPKIGIWHRIKFTRKGTKYELSENGKVTKTGELKHADIPGLGLYAQGLVVIFKNLTLQEPKQNQ